MYQNNNNRRNFNNNNYDRNNNNGNQRKKINSQKFTKMYSKFEDGIIDIYDQFKTINELLTNSSVGGTVKCDIDSTIKAIIASAAVNSPAPEARANLLWEYTISAKRVFVKTNNYIGFGWDTKSIPTDDGYVTKYIFNVVLFGNNNGDDIDYLSENGWSYVDPNRYDNRNNNRR